MDAKDVREMEVHGITCETRHTYFYKDFKYDRLDDAIRYAKIDAERDRNGEGKP